MSNWRIKTKDRILTVLLTLMMIIGLIPNTVLADSSQEGDYVITVQDSEGTPLEGAKVTYAVEIDGDETTPEVRGTDVETTTDGTVTIDLSAYVADITEETPAILTYTVTMDGYVEKSNSASPMSITSATGSTMVSLETSQTPDPTPEPTPDTYEVSVSVTGDALVKLNGTEQTRVEVEPGVVLVEISVEEGSYIKSITIGGQPVELTDSQSYNDSVEVMDTDITIDVVVVKQYMVSVNDITNGAVKLNGSIVESLVVDDNESVNVEIEAEDGYYISSVAINGAAQEITDVTNTHTMSLNVTADVEITVTFVKVYTVVITVVGNGAVVTDPIWSELTDGGKVTVVTGSGVNITANPDDNYRVSEVLINGTPDADVTGENYTNEQVYTKELAMDSEYTVVITFAPNQYTVSVTPPQNGSVSVGTEHVEYDGNSVITITPDAGYEIESAIVAGVDVIDNLTVQDGKYTYTIENITEDVEVVVSFSQIVYSVEVGTVENGTVEIETGDVTYGNDKKVTFIPSEGYEIESILINGAAVDLSTLTSVENGYEYVINNITKDQLIVVVYSMIVYDITIDEIKQGLGNLPVGTVTVDKDSLTYEEAQDGTVTVTISPAIGYEIGEITVNDTIIINVTEIANGVEFTIDNITENLLITVTFNILKFSVSAEDNVDGTVEIEDEEVEYSSLTTVVITPNSGHDVSEIYINDILLTSNQYTVAEDGTVEIIIENIIEDKVVKVVYIEVESSDVDFEDLFDVDNAIKVVNGMYIYAKDEVVVFTTTESGIRIYGSNNVLVGGGKNTQSVSISEDTVITKIQLYYQEDGALRKAWHDVRSLTEQIEIKIDKSAPEGTIRVDENNAWSDLLGTLTFGIWSQGSITVTAIAEDDLVDIAEIAYYYDENPTGILDIATLESKGFRTEPYTIDSDAIFVVYARITDQAGNVLYLGTNGLVIDKSSGTISVELSEEKDFHTTDVQVNISVFDEILSGIKTVEYQVIKDANTENPVSSEVTNLFTYDAETIYPNGNGLSVNSTTGLVSGWTGKITVPASTENNSDCVKVLVIVTDNAGNKYEEFVTFAIYNEEPSVTITFDDAANKIVNNLGYFGDSRVATIVIKDRASVFDGDSAKQNIVVSAVDADGNPITLTSEDLAIGEWEHDGDIHTLKVTFNAEGKYTWSFAYINKANISCDSISVGDSHTPYNFVIDTAAPEGQIIVDQDPWKILLEVLTFGIFRTEELQVAITGNDELSPVEIGYYIDGGASVLTKDALDQKVFSSYDQAFSIGPDQKYVVYAKIADYAGNYVYICSNGYVIDTSESGITITPEYAEGETAQNTVVFNDDVKVKIDVTDINSDADAYSGIKSVKYQLYINDVEQYQELVSLYTFDINDPTYEQLKDVWNGEVVVEAGQYNVCNIKIYVEVYDNAGNKSENTATFCIDTVAPTIGVTFADIDSRGNGFFNGDRVATITIVEYADHFDAEKATNGIKVVGTNAKGTTILTEEDITISNWTSNGDSHTATVIFAADANYEWSISYVDDAGNANVGVTVEENQATWNFSIDGSKPTGTITATSKEGRTVTWNELRQALTFGFWSKEGITITGTYEDETSTNMGTVEYYKVSGDKAKNLLGKSELDSEAITWQPFNTLTITSDEQFVIYLKITDMAGNYTYISTNGLIVDTDAPIEEVIAPEITINPVQPVNGIYSDDVKVTITVKDPLTGGTLSGLKSIRYEVKNNGTVTQSGTLFTFELTNPTIDEIRVEAQTWTGEIVVDSAKNNSNNVEIFIYAQDNALNDSDESVSIKIDTTAPTIDISYDNNTADNEFYFNADRIATIVVTERNFNQEDVLLMITNADGVIPKISEWTKTEGSSDGNGDDTTWTATLVYSADGDYEFDIEYTDLSGNECEDISYGDSVAPTSFTVDKTLPTISVKYDNNNAKNNTFFNDVRIATIIIVEHNFDLNRVLFTQGATLDGEEITIPEITWKHNGDVHTATIVYDEDGDYTFDVTVQDMAANNSDDVNYGDSVATENFTVDKTIEKPSITGIESGMAYKGDVIPVISFSDVNYDSYKVELIRTRMGEKALDVTTTYLSAITENKQGGSSTSNNFGAIADNDGIYTLTVTMYDKAGNENTEVVTFTVNRFGSVYEYDDSLLGLIANGGAYVQVVTKDLVIKEFNADKLVSDSLVIEITRDGKPLDEVIYEVSPVINDEVAIGESGWYEYQYTISKANFVIDGVYKVSISSKDATGNAPENSNYEGKNIVFRVDTTKPEITSVVGLEVNSYNQEAITVNYTLFDTIGLKSVKILLNGQLIEEITEFNADLNNYNGTFQIGEATSAQTVQIIVEDLAGNITDTADETFTSAYAFNASVLVTTDWLAQYINNPWAVGGTVAGVVLVIMAIAFIIIRRTKKANEIV